MRKLLLQLDSSPLPSVFDQVVAYDAGADQIMSYGGVTADAVRDLVYGAIFTRGPKDLRNTAIFVGGTDMALGEQLLAAVRKTFFGPFSVSVMLDPNGSNTTAAAGVAKIRQAAGASGNLKGCRAVVMAGTGPVGLRGAGLLARHGADVAITSRKAERLRSAADAIQKTFGVSVGQIVTAEQSDAKNALDGAAVVLSAGADGVCLVPRDAWS